MLAEIVKSEDNLKRVEKKATLSLLACFSVKHQKQTSDVTPVLLVFVLSVLFPLSCCVLHLLSKDT